MKGRYSTTMSIPLPYGDLAAVAISVIIGNNSAIVTTSNKDGALSSPVKPTYTIQLYVSFFNYSSFGRDENELIVWIQRSWLQDTDRQNVPVRTTDTYLVRGIIEFCKEIILLLLPRPFVEFGIAVARPPIDNAVSPLIFKFTIRYLEPRYQMGSVLVFPFHKEKQRTREDLHLSRTDY